MRRAFQQRLDIRLADSPEVKRFLDAGAGASPALEHLATGGQEPASLSRRSLLSSLFVRFEKVRQWEMRTPVLNRVITVRLDFGLPAIRAVR